MAVTVSLRGRTKVKRVVVGKPVKRIKTQTASIDNLEGVDTTGKEQGSILIYNAQSGNFEASRNLDDQDLNGGNY